MLVFSNNFHDLQKQDKKKINNNMIWGGGGVANQWMCMKSISVTDLCKEDCMHTFALSSYLYVVSIRMGLILHFTQYINWAMQLLQQQISC